MPSLNESLLSHVAEDVGSSSSHLNLTCTKCVNVLYVLQEQEDKFKCTVFKKRPHELHLVRVWLHPDVFVYAGGRAGPGIAVTVVSCYAVVCMIIDQRVMQDNAQCASVDCFAVSTAGSRIVVSLQTAKAV